AGRRSAGDPAGRADRAGGGDIRGAAGDRERRGGGAGRTSTPATHVGRGESWAVDALRERLGGVDAVAVGPGLGRDEETLAFVRSLVAASPVPVVVDADGLTAFAGRLEELGDAADLVLTPHSGEFSRLAGIPVDEVNADR